MSIDSVGVCKSLLNAYADGDGLTDQELSEIREDFALDKSHLGNLKEIVQDGHISYGEKEYLAGKMDWLPKFESPRAQAAFDDSYGIFSDSDDAIRNLSGSDGLALMRARLQKIELELSENSNPEDLDLLVTGLLHLYRDESLAITSEMISETESYYDDSNGYSRITQPHYYTDIWKRSSQGKKQTLLINELPKILSRLTPLLKSHVSTHFDHSVVSFIRFIADRSQPPEIGHLNEHPATIELNAVLKPMKDTLLSSLLFVYADVAEANNPSEEYMEIALMAAEAAQLLSQ